MSLYFPQFFKIIFCFNFLDLFSRPKKELWSAQPKNFIYYFFLQLLGQFFNLSSTMELSNLFAEMRKTLAKLSKPPRTPELVDFTSETCVLIKETLQSMVYIGIIFSSQTSDALQCNSLWISVPLEFMQCCSYV